MDKKQLDNTQFHISIIGWLHIISGIFTIAIGLLVLFILAGAGFISGDPEAIPILNVVGSFVFFFLLILALPGIAAGYGLLKRYNWGRILAVIVSVFSLLNVPIGTLIGIYSLIVLLSPESSEVFPDIVVKTT